MTDTIVTIKGVRRKISTKIDKELVDRMKESIKAKNPIQQMHTFYGGGFHTTESNKNYGRQFKTIKEKHKERVEEDG